MVVLSQDVDAYGRAVDAIYRTIENPAHWPMALTAVAACTDDFGAIFIYPRDDGVMGTIVTPGLEAIEAAFHSSEWGGRDLRYARAIERGYVASGECVTDRHLVSGEEVEIHPYYVDLLRPHGLKWFAGLNISPTSKVAAALSVQRIADKPPFTDEELAVVARLGAHVEHALKISIRLLGAEARGLARAGTAAMAEYVNDVARARVGVLRAIEKHGVARSSELAALLTKLAIG